jgi:hypothetical protein
MRSALVRIVLVLSATVMLADATGWTAVCGDPDASGTITVTDGVQILRAAAGLSSGCFAKICDVDGNGNIGVTDAVNVLRAAAGLPASTTCNEPVSAFVNDVETSDGTHAVLEVGVSPVPGPNAPTTIGQPSGDSGATPGGSNTVVVPFNTESAASALALDPDAKLVFAVADLKGNLFDGFFELPLGTVSGQITLNVSFSPALGRPSFLLCPGTRVNGILSRYGILRQNPIFAPPGLMPLTFGD